VHRALFAARHDEGRKIDDPDVVRDVLLANGVDDRAVFERIDSGAALSTVRAQHERYAESHQVWGVPTFIKNDQAVFVRLMNRPDDAAPEQSIRAVERVVDLVSGWADLNEFKHTSIPR
jgi:predicted DsbA family dithiol-disulfide isomerase